MSDHSVPSTNDLPDENRPFHSYKPPKFAIRMVLIAGFGTLIAMIGAGGFYSSRIAQQTQVRSTQLRRDFLSRERALEEIRADLFESGNVVRDYILVGPEEDASVSLRKELKEIHEHMESELHSYSHSLRPGEANPFGKLTRELEAYWLTLNPLFDWTAKEKRERGDVFLHREVFPRRMAVLAIAREISDVNDQTLREEEEEIAQTSARSAKRLQINTLAGLCIGLVLAFLTVLYTLHLEETAERRHEQTVRAHSELKKLSARLVDLQESERRTISRELHDEVGQSLSVLLMEVDRLATTDTSQSAASRPDLERLRSFAQNALNVVRDMSLLLRPSMLDDLGLMAALEWQAREVFRRTGLSVNVVENNVSENLPDEYKTCVYRVVQEALNNCSKHANATRANVVVSQDEDRLRLTIEDDGTGFDTHRVRGLGLVGMSERISRLNGTLEIESREGHGTLLRIELPLSQ